MLLIQNRKRYQGKEYKGYISKGGARAPRRAISSSSIVPRGGRKVSRWPPSIRLTRRQLLIKHDNHGTGSRNLHIATARTREALVLLFSCRLTVSALRPSQAGPRNVRSFLGVRRSQVRCGNVVAAHGFWESEGGLIPSVVDQNYPV